MCCFVLFVSVVLFVLFVSVVLFVYYIYVYQCCEKCSEIECKVTDIPPTLQYLKIVKILQGMLSSRLSSDAFWVFDGIIIRFHVIKTRLKTFSSNEKLMSAGGRHRDVHQLFSDSSTACTDIPSTAPSGTSYRACGLSTCLSRRKWSRTAAV